MHTSTSQSTCWQQKILLFAENDDALKWMSTQGFIVYGNGVELSENDDAAAQVLCFTVMELD